MKVVRLVGKQRAWPHSFVLAGGECDALVALESLDTRVAAIGRAFPRGGFEARIAVVRRAFPRGDDQDHNVRVPRDGPGDLRRPEDLNVRIPANGPGLPSGPEARRQERGELDERIDPMLVLLGLRRLDGSWRHDTTTFMLRGVVSAWWMLAKSGQGPRWLLYPERVFF